VNLIERYLKAVKEQLPRAQQDDIIRELSENLHAQIEDEEATLGRQLQEAEQAVILKRFGNPMVVAARYRGDTRSVSFGRQLIGPELFPTYIKVLTINILITVLVSAVILLVGGQSLWSSAYGGFVPIVIQFVAITAIFIVADRRLTSDLGRWDPFTIGTADPSLDHGSLDGIGDHLIGPARRTTVPFATSLLDLALVALGLTWLRVVGLPSEIGFVAPGPGWADLYVPVVVVMVLALIGPALTLARPAWTQFRVATRALYDGAIAVLGLVSLGIGQWVVLAPSATTAGDMAAVIDAIDSYVRVGVAVAVVISAFSMLLELRRLRQMRAAAQADTIEDGAHRSRS
jgi:hypothetical protein